jgi:hypothetical protein
VFKSLTKSYCTGVSVWTRANNISYHFPGASSSLSDIVMTDTAGDGVSCIVMVCCRPGTTCWDCLKKMGETAYTFSMFQNCRHLPFYISVCNTERIFKLTAEQTILPLQSDQWCSTHSEVLNPVIKKILSILPWFHLVSMYNFFQWYLWLTSSSETLLRHF